MDTPDVDIKSNKHAATVWTHFTVNTATSASVWIGFWKIECCLFVNENEEKWRKFGGDFDVLNDVEE